MLLNWRRKTCFAGFGRGRRQCACSCKGSRADSAKRHGLGPGLSSSSGAPVAGRCWNPCAVGSKRCIPKGVSKRVFSTVGLFWQPFLGDPAGSRCRASPPQSQTRPFAELVVTRREQLAYESNLTVERPDRPSESLEGVLGAPPHPCGVSGTPWLTLRHPGYRQEANLGLGTGGPKRPRHAQDTSKALPRSGTWRPGRCCSTSRAMAAPPSAGSRCSLTASP